MMITNKTFNEIQIGDSARMQRTLTKQDIDVFGLMSGDMNPTHFSDEYALMLLDRHKLVGHSMWGGALISSLWETNCRVPERSTSPKILSSIMRWSSATSSLSP